MKNTRDVSILLIAFIFILFLMNMNIVYAGDLDSGSWLSNSSIVNGLPSVSNPTPTVFDSLGTWKLISGNSVGTFSGWDWNGTGWTSNSSVISGLLDVGTFSAPVVFNDSGTLKLITGERYGAFIGYHWSGSAWVPNSTVVSGLGNVGDRSTLTVFNDGGTWKLITGNFAGTFSGYYWSGSAWIPDSDVVSGLGDIGLNSAPTVFNDSGTLILIAGEQQFVHNGYYWSGSTWVSDSSLVAGLPTSGHSNLVPAVYSESGIWKLISGDDGTNAFIGFQWIPRPPNPVSLNGVSSHTWANWTWSAGSGSLNTDSYNVSINTSWTNGSANTYYNHYLGEAGGTSTIVVWAYNLSNDILSAGNVTDNETTLYTPPNPINLANSTSGLNVNFTFAAGAGVVTDSFNISTNNGTGLVWNNASSNLFSNTSTSAHGSLEIIIYAYNNSGTGTLSAGYLTDNVTVPNNLIIITNTSDWLGYENSMVYVDFNFTDLDSDTPTFSCNRTDLFIDFNTTTGTGNWIVIDGDEGTHFVNFSVNDGHGSTDNYIMSITVLDYLLFAGDKLEDIVPTIHGGWDNGPYDVWKATDGSDTSFSYGSVIADNYNQFLLWEMNDTFDIDVIRWYGRVTSTAPVDGAQVILYTSLNNVNFTTVDSVTAPGNTQLVFDRDVVIEEEIRYIKMVTKKTHSTSYSAQYLLWTIEANVVNYGISGTVTSNGDEIENAVITFVSLNDTYYTTTNSVGYYSIEMLDATYTMTVTHTGFYDYESVVVLDRENVVKDVSMSRIISHRPTPVIAVIPTVLPTVEPTPILFPIDEEESLTIFEYIMSYLSTAFSWLFILAAYIGAFASSSLSYKKSEDFEETKYDILLFGTLGWVVPLFINFAGLLTLITESFWLNAIIFAVFGFVVYTIGDAFSKD